MHYLHLCLRCVVGLWFGLIGWTGASVLVGFCLYEISETCGIKISHGSTAVVCVVIGAITGGAPVAKLGLGWAWKKWPIDEER